MSLKEMFCKDQGKEMRQNQSKSSYNSLGIFIKLEKGVWLSFLHHTCISFLLTKKISTFSSSHMHLHSQSRKWKCLPPYGVAQSLFPCRCIGRQCVKEWSDQEFLLHKNAPSAFDAGHIQQWYYWQVRFLSLSVQRGIYGAGSTWVQNIWFKKLRNRDDLISIDSEY